MTPTITLSGPLPAGTYTLSPVGVVVTSPPPPPSSGVWWLYNDGVDAAGELDYDYGSGSVTYDVADPLVAGGKCIAVKGDEGWQPRMPNDNFNTAGYTFLLLSVYPTTQDYAGTVGAEMIGDKPIPGSTGMINFMQYGPNPPVINQWNPYKIPLSAMSFPAAGIDIYKLGVLDQNPNKTGDVVYYKAVGFSPT